MRRTPQKRPQKKKKNALIRCKPIFFSFIYLCDYLFYLINFHTRMNESNVIILYRYDVVSLPFLSLLLLLFTYHCIIISLPAI